MARTPKTYDVSVTARDIRRGVRISPERCPVARAVRRATWSHRVRVFPHAAFVRPVFSRMFVRLEFPVAATDWILAFDNGDPVQPFHFQATVQGT